MTPDGDPDSPRLIRRLLRGAATAALATALPSDEAGPALPYSSLVLSCVDHDASPLLLISDLAEHSKAISSDPNVALLYDGTAGLANPLSGPRVSVMGRTEKTAEARLMDRFVARHPGAALYREFADFHLYRVALTRAHLVAGFGRIEWLDAEEFLLDTQGKEVLALQESGVLESLNQTHTKELGALAKAVSGNPKEGAAIVGIDPEGADLRQGGALVRVEFGQIVDNPDGVAPLLRALAKKT